MREYKIKRGHYADIEQLLSSYFGAKGDIIKATRRKVHNSYMALQDEIADESLNKIAEKIMADLSSKKEHWSVGTIKTRLKELMKEGKIKT